MATLPVVLKSVSFNHDNQPSIFSGINLSLEHRRYGLVGSNGCGKSTLIQLIAGKLSQRSGSIHSQCNISMVEQLKDIRALCIADALNVKNIWQALQAVNSGEYNDEHLELLNNQWDIEHQARSALAQFNLDLDLDTPLQQLSGGQRSRVFLASAFMPQYDFLLLDEPSNHIDLNTRQVLYEVINNESRGMLIASHDRALLEQMDAIIEIDSKGLHCYGGNYSFYLEQKQIERNAAEQALSTRSQQLKTGLSQMQTRMERHSQAKAKGIKAKRAEIKAKGSYDKLGFKSQQGRSEKTQRKILTQARRKHAQLSHELADAKARQINKSTLRCEFDGAELHAKKVLIDMQQITFSYNEQPLIEQFNLKITGGTRLALKGNNGCGKSTIIKMIQSQLTPLSGIIERHTQRIAYLDQHATGLNSELTIIENFQVMNPQQPLTDSYRHLDHFLFRNQAARKAVNCLSGGERVRALLACQLLGDEPPELLLLDEPTNHLDIDSIHIIEQALASYPGAMVVASHDESFLNNININEAVTLTAGD